MQLLLCALSLSLITTALVCFFVYCRCGLGPNADVWSIYPSADIRAAVDSTVERLRSTNSELQRQNDALEEQRTRLLRALRVHAEQAS